MGAGSVKIDDQCRLELQQKKARRAEHILVIPVEVLNTCPVLTWLHPLSQQTSVLPDLARTIGRFSHGNLSPSSDP